MAPVSGTAGYAEEADSLFERYERISFAEVHRSILHLLPAAPCWVLDIGSGTGRDAAALDAMGYRVVAVEPTAEMRERAAILHPSPRIQWINDSLPDLAKVTRLAEQFELVMLTAVWMHLDEPQRRCAMPRVAALVGAGGIVSITLRRGPVPQGRRMFHVSADETIALAEAEGLRLLRKRERTPSPTTPNVSWTRLVLGKPDKAA